MGREGCCKQITLACARSASATLALPPLTVHTAQALCCSTGNCLRWALCCMCFPGLSRSGDQVFGKCGCSYLLPLLSLPLGFLGVQLAHLLRLKPKKSWLAMKPTFSLVDDVSLGPQLPPSSPGCPHSPVSDREWAGPQLATSALSFVL